MRFVATVLVALLAFAQADPKARIKTIKELGKKDGTAGMPELAGFLKDPDDEVRREAVKAIVQVGTQHSLDPLIEATKDNDEEIQIRATDGLVNFYYAGYILRGLSGSIKRIGKGVKGKFSDTNDQMIEGYIEVRPEVTKGIARLVKDGASLTVKANAARACGVLRAKESAPALLEALRTKGTQLIYESLVALQKIRDPETATGITFLLQDLNDKVQMTAIETTGLLMNKKALPDLREAVARGKSVKVRSAAIAAMAMIPDEASRTTYEKYIEDKEDALRASAAEGYARLKNPADAALMAKLFEGEGRMQARLSLAFAACSLGKTELAEFSPLQYLVNTLNSASYRGVSQAFLRELSRDKKVRESLYRVMDQRTKAEKLELAVILAREGDAETVPVLENLTKDRDTEVGKAAALALRNLKARFP